MSWATEFFCGSDMNAMVLNSNRYQCQLAADMLLFAGFLAVFVFVIIIILLWNKKQSGEKKK